jgi:hypothetical protein
METAATVTFCSAENDDVDTDGLANIALALFPGSFS